MTIISCMVLVGCIASLWGAAGSMLTGAGIAYATFQLHICVRLEHDSALAGLCCLAGWHKL